MELYNQHWISTLRMRLSGSGRNRTTGIVSLIVFLSCLGIAGCEKAQTEMTAENRMAGMLVSRSSIGEVKTFREQNYIHGLSFFYFHVSGDDAARVVAWLKMKERDSIPPILSDRVRSASSGTDWKFKWNGARIFVTYYCHPFDGTNRSVDMLLVDQGKAVLVTEGFLPPGSYVTDDPASCDAPQHQSAGAG